MHNDSRRISANEINRYVYCNYQWYYRRLYGDAKLTKLKKEHNKTLRIQKDPRTHGFARGNKFHQDYHRWYKAKKAIYQLFGIILLMAGLYFIGPTLLKGLL